MDLARIADLTLSSDSSLLTGRYGLGIDNLLSARVVFTNRIVLNSSEDGDSDLFWGIRGGGPNFGIVVEFTYRVHKEVDVYHVRTGEDESTSQISRYYARGNRVNRREITPSFGDNENPKERSTQIYCPIVGFAVCNIGGIDEAIPFANISKPSGLVDEPPNHQKFSNTSVFMPHPFDVEIMEKLIQEFDDFHDKHGDALAPSRVIIEMRSYKVGGAIPSSAISLAAREKTAQYDSSQISHTVTREEINRMIGPVKEAVKKQGSRKFTNANLGSGTERTQDMFGQNYARLREIKRKYDPEFIFKKWYPIPPAEHNYTLKL
ncbi:uncharacterized protein EAF01_008118 [Botrytis porri]|uniref:uncharacterized protein n=1 Tax=Botrytis porri TaxID=87229 RepID=UPI00190045DF|nr:uncharacterized protein EAF01_008118 [Botrytis porri]KAF7898905.1 hypothetical protein EAF01_008118 [Botrytis porri]